MSVPESILQKIKLLQSLGNSPNANEAETALAMVARLIAKYNITQDDLNSIADKAPAYGEEEKLFQTIGVVSWMSQLALAIGNKYDCSIVQETIKPLDSGPEQNNYYAYGDPEDVEDVKFVWGAFSKKVEELVLINCINRGPIFIHSYTEGVTQSIRFNLETQDIDIPKVNLTKTKEEVKPDAIVSTGVVVEKEKPTTETYNVNANSLVKDIMAYFKGLEDGKEIKLQSVLDLEQSAKITALPKES
jgi:hypothetical protein